MTNDINTYKIYRGIFGIAQFNTIIVRIYDENIMMKHTKSRWFIKLKNNNEKCRFNSSFRRKRNKNIMSTFVLNFSVTLVLFLPNSTALILWLYVSATYNF